MTPDSFLSRLFEIFPDFAAQWSSPDDLFREDDGAFTYCGVFAEFGAFFREHYRRFPKPQLAELSTLLDECMSEDGSEINTAASTCFLENVAGEPFSRNFGEYLRGTPARYFAQFDG